MSTGESPVNDDAGFPTASNGTPGATDPDPPQPKNAGRGHIRTTGCTASEDVIQLPCRGWGGNGQPPSIWLRSVPRETSA